MCVDGAVAPRVETTRRLPKRASRQPAECDAEADNDADAQLRCGLRLKAKGQSELLEGQLARGGGTAGDARWQSPNSSPGVQMSQTLIPRHTSHRGGGNAAPAANHSATTPPQASIARRTTVLGCGDCSCSDPRSSDSVVVSGVPARDWYSLQISGPSMSKDGAQQADFADFVAQHPVPAVCGSAATLRSRAVRTPASTL